MHGHKITSTAGKFHAYYRNSGERRRIRPFLGLPIDVIGAGLIVVPPSKTQRGTYEIIQGNLDDLECLPPMRHAAPEIKCAQVREGGRNNTLWAQCMRQAHYCDTFDALLDVARTFNDQANMPPLSDAEVVKIATSAWRYTERNENWFGFGRRVAFPHATVDRLAAQDPYALALLSVLKRLHGGRDHFILAKETAHKLGWSLPAFKAARKRLEVEGEIRCISRGGRGAHDPPRYTWK